MTLILFLNIIVQSVEVFPATSAFRPRASWFFLPYKWSTSQGHLSCFCLTFPPQPWERFQKTTAVLVLLCQSCLWPEYLLHKRDIDPPAFSAASALHRVLQFGKCFMPYWFPFRCKQGATVFLSCCRSQTHVWLIIALVLNLTGIIHLLSFHSV